MVHDDDLHFHSMWDKLAELETRCDEAKSGDAELCEAMLDYVRSHLEAPWMAAGRRLEKLLIERLNRNGS